MGTFTVLLRRATVMAAAAVAPLTAAAQPAPATAPVSGAPAATAPTTGPTVRWDRILSQPPAFYTSDDARRIAKNVMLWQQEAGGWNKNIEMAKFLSAEDEVRILGEKARNAATIDNDATTSQIRFLARMAAATGDAQYAAAGDAGVAYLLRAQYADSGGWPQYFPLRGGYHDHITYNDNSMLRVLMLMDDLAAGRGDFASASADTRGKAAAALARGIECVLKTQIVADGKRTAWCAQHDAKTLAPAKGRSYELPSISGAESVGLVRFLMKIEHPSPQIVDAIDSAVAWFDAVKITGKRVHAVPNDRILVDDPTADPLWARFYEVGTNRPIYCNRDGVIQYDYMAIQPGRRTAYAWIRPWATDLLAKDYPAWKAARSTASAKEAQ